MSQVTQMPIPLQEGPARSPHSKGKVPQNEEDHKLRQLQTQTLPDLALLCSCSRSSPLWELDGCLCHLHLGSGSSQALTASPSGLGCRKELINPPSPVLHFTFLLLASSPCQTFQKPFHVLIMQALRTIAAAGPWGQATE